MWMLGLYNMRYAEAIRNGYTQHQARLLVTVRNTEAWARDWLNRHQLIRWIDT